MNSTVVPSSAVRNLINIPKQLCNRKRKVIERIPISSHISRKELLSSNYHRYLRSSVIDPDAFSGRRAVNAYTSLIKSLYDVLYVFTKYYKRVVHALRFARNDKVNFTIPIVCHNRYAVKFANFKHDKKRMWQFLFPTLRRLLKGLYYPINTPVEIRSINT
jgi:hypothetical protein